MNIVKRFAVTATYLAFAGCTVVRVDGPGAVTMLRPGVLQVVPAPGAPVTAYRVRGFGLVPGHGGATLGYAREDAVIIQDSTRCQIVLFDMPSDAASWRQLLRDHPDICTRGTTQ